MKVINTVIHNADAMTTAFYGEPAMTVQIKGSKTELFALWNIIYNDACDCTFNREDYYQPEHESGDELIIANFSTLNSEFFLVRNHLLANGVELANEVRFAVDGENYNGGISRYDFNGVTDIMTDFVCEQFNIPFIIKCCDACDCDCVLEEHHDTVDVDFISEALLFACSDELQSGAHKNLKFSYQLKY